MAEERTRTIYYGDNLDILREHISPESVDLVYLDPPFKSQQDYNLLFRSVKGEPASAQVRAFTDTWKWDTAAKATYEWLLEAPRVPGKVSEMAEAFYKLVGPSEMLAYLVMMTPRLMELHRVLRDTGSLYLHCDPAASHYLKLVLDTIFGPANFRNEIVWRRSHPKGHAFSRFARNHDVILAFAKGADIVRWDQQYSPHNLERTAKQYSLVDETGRRYQLTSLLNPNRNRPNLTYEFKGVTKVWRWTKERMLEEDKKGRIMVPRGGRGIPRYKRYLDEQEGVPVDDFWSDIEFATASERLGYETQKPLNLLKRIIQASTNPGDLVLDPFCGCGTALVAAEELGRSWIGIDITYLAVDVMARRLRDHFPGISFEITGQPRDEEGAGALAERDRFQFQVWALSQVGAQSLDPDRKVADRGIDGYLPFLEEAEKYQRAIVQVKSGRVGVREVRDLRGTLEREKAPFALLITLEPPTRDMRQEGVEAGFYRVQATNEEIPRLQILTIGELFQGQRPRVPTTVVSFMPTAPRLQRARGRQLPLDTQPPQDREEE